MGTTLFLFVNLSITYWYSIENTYPVVPNIKDTFFWKQFTTPHASGLSASKLFRISKIHFFESNSQQWTENLRVHTCCSEYQRYIFLKAIHNDKANKIAEYYVVPNIKDTFFWKQFTTKVSRGYRVFRLFRISKIHFFESNSQQTQNFKLRTNGCSEYQRYIFLKAIHNSFGIAANGA